MSRQNKWKQIVPEGHHIDDPDDNFTYTISDDDYKKLSNMLPSRQSNVIDDLSDLGTFIYYSLINLMNIADNTNDVEQIRHAIYHTYELIGNKLPEDIKLKAFEEENAEITKKMREQGIDEGRIYSHIKDKPKEPMATVPNEPAAKSHLAGETTPEEDALISQAIKNALQGVM